jgi:hypothetical protein
MPADMPSTGVSVDRATGVLRDSHGQPIRERYVLAASSVNLLGSPVARDAAKKLVLYRVTPPARTTEQIIGLYDDPTSPWSGPEVTWQRVNCTGGMLHVEVSSDTRLFQGVTQTLAISGTTAPKTFRLTQKNSTRSFTLPLTPQAGVCRVVFEISPTRIPANFPQLKLNDPRRLGLHFDVIRYKR